MKWLIFILPLSIQAQTYEDSLRLWEVSRQELRRYTQAEDEYKVLEQGGMEANTLLAEDVGGRVRPIGYTRFKHFLTGQILRVYRYPRPRKAIYTSRENPGDNVNPALHRELEHIQSWVGVPNLKIVSDYSRGRLEPFAIQNLRGERIPYGQHPSVKFQFQ